MSTAAVPVTEPTQEPKTVVLCEHIKDNGHRCGSPAIRGRHFCYHHSRAHAPSHLGTRQFRATLPETIESLQITIKQVTEALGSGRITDRTAGKLLYAVQLSSNLLKMSKADKDQNNKKQSQKEETNQDDQGAPFKPSVAFTGVVNDDESTEPVTEIPPAMEEALAPPPPNPDDPTPIRPIASNDPDMPVTIEEAERALLQPKQVIDAYHALSKCDRLSPRYDKILRRISIHNRAFSILYRNGRIPDSYLEEFSLYPEKNSRA